MVWEGACDREGKEEEATRRGEKKMMVRLGKQKGDKEREEGGRNQYSSGKAEKGETFKKEADLRVGKWRKTRGRKKEQEVRGRRGDT